MPDLQDNITALLKNVGVPGNCKGCQAPIWWVRHKNAKLVPYTAAGLNHFIDCPRSAQFRAPKGGAA